MTDGQNHGQSVMVNDMTKPELWNIFTMMSGTNQRNHSPSLCRSCVNQSLKFCRVHFFWKHRFMSGSFGTLTKCIHSFNFHLIDENQCRMCVKHCKDLPRRDGIFIMELHSQKQFEKLISIFKVPCNLKENVDPRGLA